MPFPSRSFIAALTGLCMTLASRAQEPGRFQMEREQPSISLSEASSNQQVAQSIAEQLRQSEQLHRYCVDVVFKGGTADLSGSVTDQLQREEVLRIVQGTPG